MARKSSLSRQVSFQQVLPVLGSRVISLALPTVALCPVCQSSRQLHIYHDPVFKGEWSHCRNCAFSGDMINLAATVWKLGIPQTLYKLCQLVPEINSAITEKQEISAYQQFHVDARTRLGAFWKTCQLDHIQAETSELRMLQRRFGCFNPADDWNKRAGQFIGSTVKDKVDACFEPNRFKNFTNTSNSNYYSSRIFRGGKWKHVIAVPFYDLPGRVCGFLFVGREANREKDYVYRAVPNGTGFYESGLAMLDALLLPPHIRLGKTGFVFTDVDVAMRFHIRHMADTQRPLPLAATWQDSTHTTSLVWDWLTHTDLVFWGYDIVEAIHQAMQANGRVSLLAISQGEKEINMRHYAPVEWLERMRTTAVPWRTALRSYLLDLNEIDVEGTLLSLGLQGRQLTEFIQDCDDQLRTQLLHVEQHRTYAAKIRFEKKWIFEKANGWYLEKGEDCLCNFIVRVDQVLTTTDHRSYYRGTIKFAGNAYPFTEKASTLDQGMFVWAQRYLRDVVQAGVAEYYPAWNEKSVHLAMAFHAPTLAQGTELIGWDNVNRQFNFPSFSICRNGNITNAFSCLFTTDNVPAKSIPPPAVFPRRHIATLGDENDETRIFWAVAACVAANIIAPATNRSPIPVLLDGAGAIGVGTSAAIRMGCCEVITKGPVDMVRSLSTAKGPHTWPMVVRDADKTMRAGLWLDHEVAKYGIYSLHPATNRVLAIRGRANMISCRRKLGSMQLAHNAAPYVIANYLQDAYKRNLWITDTHDSLTLNVLDDMIEWFARCGGNRNAVEAARHILHVPGPASARKHFMSLVFQLYENGSLTFARTEYDDRRRGRAGIVETGGGSPHVWVSQDRFSDAVKIAGSLPPDLLLITNALKAKDVLLSEPTYREEQGWLIDEKWWNQQLKNWREYDR